MEIKSNMTIHSLRPEFRPDNSRNQVRASQSLARRLYILSLGAGVTWVLYLLFGSLVLMDASGLVVQEREIVTEPFDAQVVSFTARPGEKVAAGQQLGSVVSTQMLDLIPGLITRKAQLEARQNQIVTRLAAISSTLPAAERRSGLARAAQDAIAKAVTAGYSTLVRQAEASRDAFDAVREVEALRTEQNALEGEGASAKLTLVDLADTLARAQATYRNGVVTSSVDGTLGAKVAVPGAVLSHGEVMAEVYHGAKYVLAYLPTNRMYGVKAGEKVLVTDGVNHENGRIERVETITDRTPPEFQSSLHGVDRDQVVRVEFNEPTEFPLLSKIRITGPYSLSNLFDGALNSLNWRGAAVGKQIVDILSRRLARI